MTQEQITALERVIVALERVLELAEFGLENEIQDDQTQDDYNSLWSIHAYLIEQRRLVSLQQRINALEPLPIHYPGADIPIPSGLPTYSKK